MQRPAKLWFQASQACSRAVSQLRSLAAVLLLAHRLDHPLPEHLGGVLQHGDLQVVAGLKVGEQAAFRHLAGAGKGADGEALQPLLARLLERSLQNVVAGQPALAHRTLLH